MSRNKLVAIWAVSIYFGGAAIGPLPSGFPYAGLAGWLSVLGGVLISFSVVMALGAVGLWAEGANSIRFSRR